MRNKLTFFLRFIIIFYALLFSSLAAANQDPTELLEDTTKELLSILKNNRSEFSKNPDKIYALVRDVLVPKVDFNEMAKWVAGRNGWLKATDSERNDFVNAFSDLVVRTYAGTLNSYTNQVVSYKAPRSGYDNKTRVQVTSTISEAGRNEVNVAYRLVKKQSNWKVYDIIIEGVSMIKGFQSQFSEDISRQGLAFVTNKINTHNKKANS